ncbi:sensor histidine kinase [Planctomyces sp. SH-PL62]|uniref:sensor histidine kinase n=1 Tax=Planctomyces sp. SH-PL62 TaxID=1636152 RepID=UPI00078B5BC4|nr:ATP-binding protein [Planctomyces sp. SH-PL62]AMV39864.1 Alkaline phosphatase synthesis sensor protein PhoR [Planctomyces sp. SH-PL62]
MMAYLASTLVAVAAVAILAIVLRRARAARDVARGLARLAEGRRARPVLVLPSGRLGALVAAFNAAAPEVHERTRRLEADRQQLRVVLGAMAEAVLAVDPRRRLLFANASADALFGLDASSVGRLMPELIRSPQVHDAVEATFRLVHPDAYLAEFALPGRDVLRLAPRILSVRGSPLPGGQAAGAVLVFHDVTDLRRLERMRQDFVANASHELKTPLASIKAYAETLIDWALEDPAVNRRFLERIAEQIDRLDALIRDMLALARLEANQDVFRHEPLVLIPVLERLVEAHRDRAEAGDLTLSIDAGGLDRGVTVLADEEAMRQIVDNLIDNAIKYTPPGGRVKVVCSATAGEVAVEVSDTGVGIPREDQGRIFERFYRVDRARSRELGGTGLGLAIVKHLVSSLDGRVEVASRLSSGSRFTVRLPRAAAPITPVAPPASAAPPP